LACFNDILWCSEQPKQLLPTLPLWLAQLKVWKDE
jgi:hypothetical protein